MTPLDYEASQLSPAERLEEKERIIKILMQQAFVEDLSEREQQFVEDMRVVTVVSPKQLAWLRRIKDKLL